MIMEKERQDIVDYSRKLVSSGLTVGTGGNISIYDPATRFYAITPSGIDYFEMEAEDVVVLDLKGNIIEGKRKASSEVALHRIMYENRSDLKAVVHTHSTYCTVLATNHMELPASSYLVAFAGKNVRCAPYASFGTEELARVTFEAMKERKAALMANHGLIAGGNNIIKAFEIVQQIEFCAKVYVKALSVGRPHILSDEEMESMIVRFQDYGQKQK